MRNLRCGRTSPALTFRSQHNSPSLHSPSPIMDPGCLYGSIPEGIRHPITPPVNKKIQASSPGPRRNWIQRHSRRPNTVNIDENTMSGENSSIFCNSNEKYPDLSISSCQPCHFPNQMLILTWYNRVNHF